MFGQQQQEPQQQCGTSGFAGTTGAQVSGFSQPQVSGFGTFGGGFSTGFGGKQPQKQTQQIGGKTQDQLKLPSFFKIPVDSSTTTVGHDYNPKYGEIGDSANPEPGIFHNIRADQKHERSSNQMLKFLDTMAMRQGCPQCNYEDITQKEFKQIGA